jgi:peptidoglycan-N-acetylglucosamine deacetylase
VPPVPADPTALRAPLPGQSEWTADGGTPRLLESCWTPAQLSGSADERRSQTGLKLDRDPPPVWAREEARLRIRALGPVLSGSIRSVEPTDPQARLVALTFDLCERGSERAGYDAALVDWLRSHRVKATFFAGGKWMRSHPERAMQLMADPLFEVGNHGWSHANLRMVQGKAAVDEILDTQAEYLALRRELAERPCAARVGTAALGQIPERPRVFRFPYGTCSADTLGLPAEMGLAAIQWSVVTGDPDKSRGAKEIAAAVVAGVRGSRGAIVVAHANGRGWHTAESLPLLVPQLEASGYRFVTVSELLAAGNPVAVQECFEQRPGDNRRYDKLTRAQAK